MPIYVVFGCTTNSPDTVSGSNHFNYVKPFLITSILKDVMKKCIYKIQTF